MRLGPAGAGTISTSLGVGSRGVAHVVTMNGSSLASRMPRGIVRQSPSHWIVVNTHPHRESAAVEHLVRQGFSAYCPMIVKRIRHARRAYDAKRPLFTGYVFVQHTANDHQWRPILSTFGVRSVVRCGPGPGFLKAEFVDGLMAREVAGVIRKPEQPFKIGQQVAVQGGIFDGMIGEIIGLQDKERVLVLLSLLNSSAKARLSVQDLRPV